MSRTKVNHVETPNEAGKLVMPDSALTDVHVWIVSSPSSDGVLIELHIDCRNLWAIGEGALESSPKSRLSENGLT